MIETSVLQKHVNALFELERQKLNLAEDVKIVKADAKRAGINTKALAVIVKKMIDPAKAAAEEMLKDDVAQYELLLDTSSPVAPTIVTQDAFEAGVDDVVSAAADGVIRHSRRRAVAAE